MTSDTPPLSPPHRSALTVSWGDCDPAGIVFYPRYFEWFDRATHQLLRALGLDHAQLIARWGLLGLSLVDAHATFRRPARLGAALTLDSRVAALGTTSLTLEHHIKHDEQLLVEGREVRVWVVRAADDPTRLHAAPIPDEVRQRLSAP